MEFGVYSDHSPQFFTVKTQSKCIQQQLRSTRLFKESNADWATYQSSFPQSSINLISNLTNEASSTHDIDCCIKVLTDTIRDAGYHSLPRLKQSKKFNSSRPVWWDKEVETLYRDTKRFKNQLHRTTCPVLTNILRDKYLTFRTRLTKLTKSKSSSSWKSFLSDGDKEEALTWGNAYKFIRSRLKEATNDLPILCGDSSTVKANAANLLSTFFPTLPFSIDYSSKEATSDRTSNPLSYQYQFTCDLIKSLNDKKAPGHDGISNSMIKNLPSPLITCIHSIVNKCLQLGYFPTEWKRAIVRILPKANKVDYSVPAAYRPVSLTPNLSKLLEKVINFHLVHHIETTNFLSNAQYGFRPNRSTTDALKRIISLIPPHTQRLRRAIVSFDFRSAFDHAPHLCIIKALKEDRKSVV